MRIAISLEYLGTGFYGWQKQRSISPTLQQTLEQAISTVAGHPVEVVCAGRTDREVHACHQVIHFDTDSVRAHRSWLLGIQSNMPRSIRIKSIVPVDDNFHARFDASSRRYRYHLVDGYPQPALLHQQVTWTHETVDVDLMHQASQILVGEHDFTSFRAVECQAHTPIRTIESLKVTRQGRIVCFDITANAFLHHMVRNIVGSLLLIGTHKKPVEWLGQALAGKDRRLAGPTAAAQGLYLVDVQYPNEPRLHQAPSEIGPKFLNDV